MSVPDGSRVEAQVRLPKVELPKFSGEITKFQTFWDLFTTKIDSSSYQNKIKLSYLISYLEEDALLVAQGLPLTNGNYAIACDLLKKRLGRPEVIKISHVQSLMNLEIPSSRTKDSSYIKQLWKLKDGLNLHVRSLQQLGFEGELPATRRRPSKACLCTPRACLLSSLLHLTWSC